VSAPPARDTVVPGSARHVVIHEEYTLVTVRCGRCKHEQEARDTAKTTRCQACGRNCKVLPATPAAPNVTPIRRAS
jgi:ribosomal protein S27E